MVSRRDLLKRAPAVPFMIGAAVTQVPAMIKSIGSASYSRLTQIPQAAESTFEERIRWFTNELQWLNKPTLPMYNEGEMLSANAVRAIQQWDIFIQQVTRMASSYNIPIEEAFKIANIPH